MEKVLKRYILPIFSVLAIIGVDQWTKFLTIKYVKDTEGFYIIDKVLRIYFIKNEGMAWGMLQNKQVLFIILTPIVVGGLVFLYYRMPFEKKYVWLRVCDIFLTGGAIGNLIDRIFRGGNLFHGYVVDMIYVEIINFPVFNIADSFITVGFAMLIILTIFVYKESDFEMIFSGKNTKKAEIDANKDNETSEEDATPDEIMTKEAETENEDN